MALVWTFTPSISGIFRNQNTLLQKSIDFHFLSAVYCATVSQLRKLKQCRTKVDKSQLYTDISCFSGKKIAKRNSKILTQILWISGFQWTLFHFFSILFAWVIKVTLNKILWCVFLDALDAIFLYHHPINKSKIKSMSP